jgi:hypothetical protein
MLGTDRANLGQLLVQAALSNRSQSSKAIYHSILALASYHRGGNRVNVDLLKRAALRNLRTHTDPGMCEGAEHVAANLLLCVLEVRRHLLHIDLIVLTVTRCNKHPIKIPDGSFTSVE